MSQSLINRVPLLLMSILWICLLSLSNVTLNAQQILQMEKRGSVKTKRYFVGDEFNYKISGDKKWRVGIIDKLILDENLMVIDGRAVRVKDITDIRSFKYSRRLKMISYSLYSFGAGWMFYSVVGFLLGNPLTLSAVIVTATSATIGFLIQKIFPYKRYRIGKKRSLRILDLDAFKEGSA